MWRASELPDVRLQERSALGAGQAARGLGSGHRVAFIVIPPPLPRRLVGCNGVPVVCPSDPPSPRAQLLEPVGFPRPPLATRFYRPGCPVATIARGATPVRGRREWLEGVGMGRFRLSSGWRSQIGAPSGSRQSVPPVVQLKPLHLSSDLIFRTEPTSLRWESCSSGRDCSASKDQDFPGCQRTSFPRVCRRREEQAAGRLLRDRNERIPVSCRPQFSPPQLLLWSCVSVTGV